MTLKPFEDIFVGASIFGIGIVGFFVNAKLLEKLNKRKETLPEERMNKLYVSLLFSNFCIICLAFPIPAIASLTRNWIWGDIGCDYYGSLAMFCGLQILTTSIFIAIDLFLEANMDSYVGGLKEKVRNLLVFYTWVNALFWTLVPFLGWSSYGKESTGFSCSVVLKDSEWTGYTAFVILVIIFSYIIPVLLLGACFVLNSGNEHVNQKRNAETRMKKINLLVILMVIEWTPYCAYYTWPIFDPQSVPNILNAVAPLAAKLANIFTPMVVMSIVDEYTSNPKEKSN